LALPHAAFAASAAVFQLLLPSMVLPDNADSGPKYLDDRLKEYPAVLAGQLGIDQGHAIGMVIVLAALAGLVVGVRRRPGLDGPLVAVAVFSALAVSTHFRLVGRYYFQILPWVLMFVGAAVMALACAVVGLVTARSAHPAGRRTDGRSRLTAVVASVPLIFLVIVHVAVLPGQIGSAMDFDRSGRQQVGPTHPDYVPIYEAVAANTKPTDVVVFYRARTMTLLTDRRTLQTSNLDGAEQRADFYAQLRGSTYSQPEMAELEGYRRGYTVAWSDDRWILWDLHPE